jgi:hypothetical protein
MDKTHYFMVGMPSGGKTSYIVRLCSQLLMDEGNMMYHLLEGEMPQGYEYIKEQLDKMQSFQNIMRTFENTYFNMTLPLRNDEGKRFSLMIPDLSGEYYRKLVEERYVDKKIYDGLQQAEQILFFLNPETMEKEERLEYGEISAIKLIDESMDTMKEGRFDDEIEESEKATQSQVVELLQILLYLVKKQVTIKFVISAWDRIEKKQQGNKIIPEEYLKNNFPLLHQCVISNTDRMEYEIFGVSAQGAEYSDEEEMKKLEKDNIEIDMLVKIVMPDGTEYHDISRLLRKRE